MTLAPFEPGDIFVPDSDMDEEARFPTGMGKVRQYSAEWDLKATHETGQRGLVSCLSLDPSGRLHILDPQARWFGSIAADGQPVEAFPELPQRAYGSMIAVPEGYMLGEQMVGDTPGFSGDGRVYRIDEDGTVRAVWNTETNGGMGGFLGVTHMALSRDGTTLYHLSETGPYIYGHTLAGDRRLGPVYTRADPPPMLFGLSMAPDDTLLVAAGNAIRQVVPGEGVVRTYDLPEGRGWAVVTMRPGGKSFWALDFFGGQAVSVGFESGEIELHKQLELTKRLTSIAEIPAGETK